MIRVIQAAKSKCSNSLLDFSAHPMLTKRKLLCPVALWRLRCLLGLCQRAVHRRWDSGGYSKAGECCMAGNTILIVDDDTVFQSSLTDILNQAGYQAYGASDGQSAIRVARDLGSALDLMVLEMALPDMSGVALIQALAARQETTIKVIASSAMFSQADLDSQTSFQAHGGIRCWQGPRQPGTCRERAIGRRASSKVRWR